MNKLLFAMSTLPGKNASYEFDFEDGERITDCVGQLEPTVKYMMEHVEGDLKLIMLCTKETYTYQPASGEKALEKERVFGIGSTAVTFFIERMLKYMNIPYSEDSIRKEEYAMGHTYKIGGRLTVHFIGMDEDAPESAISEAVEYIRTPLKDEPAGGVFWVDTHGGFRDTSLIMNAILSLLKVYNIYPDKVLTSRFTDKNTLQRMVSQEKAMQMFDFVSGMNEFIQFGSADYLINYFRGREKQNKSIEVLLSAMKEVSDGTRLCDPSLYIKGLDSLGEAIENLNFSDDMLSIFVEYIKDSYGELLDRNKRTNLAIVKRCVDKKMYQQALTIIESRMCLDFFERGVLYFDEKDKNVIHAINPNKKEEDKHYVFDAFLFLLKKYYEKQTGSQDVIAIKAIDEMFGALSEDEFFKDKTVILATDKNIGKIGKIELFSNVKEEHLGTASRLFVLHKALKQCRNMTNHAGEGVRPTADNLINGLKHYIELADVVFADENLHNRPRLKSSGKTVRFTNAKEKNSDNQSTNKKNGKNSQKSDKSNKKHVVHVEKIVLREAKKRIQFKGVLDTGKNATISVPDNMCEDPFVYEGKDIEVVIINETENVVNCDPAGTL